MASGDIGYKSTIEYGDGASPEVFTPVFQVTKVTPAEKSIKTIDMTHLESPGRTNEFIAGFGEYSEVGATAIYDYTNATHGQLFTDAANGTVRNWRIRIKDSVSGAVQQTHLFSGFVSKVGIGELSPEARRELNFSIKVAGAVAIS